MADDGNPHGVVTHCPAHHETQGLVITFVTENPEYSGTRLTPGTWREFLHWVEHTYRCSVVSSTLGPNSDWADPRIYVMQFLTEKSYTMYLLRYA